MAKKGKRGKLKVQTKRISGKDLEKRKKITEEVKAVLEKKDDKIVFDVKSSIHPTKPTMQLKSEKEIALDFATKVYQRFNMIIKSVILFGSVMKNATKRGSDVDIIILVDDCSINWDQELVSWYREEMGKIIAQNRYSKSLHINTIRLSTWWEEMLRGEPLIANIIRYGEALVDFGGFFSPLKFLLQKGKINATNEAIFSTIQRAPLHLARSRSSILGAMEGIYWAMVDSAHAALITAKQVPPSPEYITDLLESVFVKNRMLDRKYLEWYKQVYELTHGILHGDVKTIKAQEVEFWYDKADKFVEGMTTLI